MPPSKSKIIFLKTFVFIITFLTYASVHSCRTTWAYSKNSIKEDPVYQYTAEFFGTCDFIFLLSYSLSFYMFSWIGDRMDLRIYLSIGLLGY